MVRQDSHQITVRAVTPADAGAVAGIYNHYVLETVVTFEEEPVTSDEMSRRIDEVRAASLPWFVAEHDGAMAGYAYASRWRTRSAYRFSSEVTVYLAPEQGRRGIDPRSTPSSFPRFEGVAFTPRSEASPFPTPPASHFTKSSGSRKSLTSNRRVSSSIAGLMSGPGSCFCSEPSPNFRAPITVLARASSKAAGGLSGRSEMQMDCRPSAGTPLALGTNHGHRPRHQGRLHCRLSCGHPSAVHRRARAAAERA